MERLKDDPAKEFVHTRVFYPLDDVDGLLLGDERTRPTSQMWEQMWVDEAETVVRAAEDAFNKQR